MNALAFFVEYQEITGRRVHSLGLFIQNRGDLYKEYRANVSYNCSPFFEREWE
ncbi:MAG: hypothetical protein OXH57_00375 [Ekhidna sp.]|nr:hypothetical protein [Ekhidna sp.]